MIIYANEMWQTNHKIINVINITSSTVSCNLLSDLTYSGRAAFSCLFLSKNIFFCESISALKNSKLKVKNQ